MTLIYACDVDRRSYKASANEVTVSEEKNSGIKRLFPSLRNEEIGVFYYIGRRFKIVYFFKISFGFIFGRSV